MFVTESDILNLNPGDMAKLAALDASGFLLAPGEGLDEFRSRLLEMRERYGAVEKQLDEKGEFDLCGEFLLKKDDRIGQDILAEAADETSKLYDLAIDWVPGFFLTGESIPLWGGCAVFLPAEKITVFMIRESFKLKKKWFIYHRDELLSHELCHVARMPVGDRFYDEFFAYRTAKSAFRRYFGSAFRSKWDSILFILPVFILLVARVLETFFSLPLPMPLFWILAGLYPAFLVCRNQQVRNTYFRAERNLRAAGIEAARSILFRCTAPEIIEISRANDNNKVSDLIGKRRTAGELRWQLIDYRFISKEECFGEKERETEDGKA